MKLLLIWPNSRNEVLGWGDLGAIAEPLALEYLAAGVRLDGHEARVLDLRLHPHELERTLREYRPDLVGVTAFSMHVLRALEVCRQAKQMLPHCWTIAGGHHATLLPEEFFEPQVDFVVAGEGVRPLRALLRALEVGSGVAEISGLWYRREGRFAPAGTGVDAERALIHPRADFTGADPDPRFDIDSLPLPDRLVTGPDRDTYFIDWMRPIALLRTTVGCPYRCSFCSLWRIMDGKYHRREVERVVEELATIREEFVFLVDDEAFIHGRRMQRLAEAIRKAGIQKRFFAYCRIDTLLREEAVLRQWREIGLERLFIGIEAITEAGLRDFNKRIHVAQVEAGLGLARTLGIEVFAQFIVSPQFGRRDFQQLIRFIEHHRIRYPSFTVLTPLPGTELLTTFDAVLEKQPNGRPNWDLFDCQNAVTETRLSPDEFRREYRNLHRVFNGSYIQYREHPCLVGAEPAAAGAAGSRRPQADRVLPFPG